MAITFEQLNEFFEDTGEEYLAFEIGKEISTPA